VAECIHGFDDGLCDVCFPRTPEPPPRAVRPATTRASRTGTTTRAAGASAAPATLRLSGRRVHHVTHLRTLESIALDGELRADAAPDVDVSSATTRELRASATVPDGRSVASLVAFSLAQDSTRWQELREGAVGTHWSDAARSARPADFVILAAPVDALGDDVVFVDGDAGGVAARFAAGLDAGTQGLRRLHAVDPDFRDAELLVAGPVPLDVVAVVTVANDRVRDEVRTMFANASLRAPRIAVYPPAFATD
jgi:ssDNA thymidine ADP-ribosyltransferase, DarT